jgi:hypothetical protein
MPINHYTIDRWDFKALFHQLQDDLVAQEPYDVGEWQSQKKDSLMMRELHNVTFSMPIPTDAAELEMMTGAHLPWAEDHFQERVSGQPMNPAPSEKWWPFRQNKDGNTNRDHKSEGEAFSHTYPERIWPKMANVGGYTDQGREIYVPHVGIRFEYGDLYDVIQLLINQPNTRQAFLPIWFPEDTGLQWRAGRRVPCTLGYHFEIRGTHLTISYFMRSTDLLRHFQDDIYMAARLAQFVGDKLGEANSVWLSSAELIFHTANLHIFDADVPLIQYRKTQGPAW